MLGHLIGEHRSAHDDPWMLWVEAATAAAAAESYNRQLQRRQDSWREKEPPPPNLHRPLSHAECWH